MEAAINIQVLGDFKIWVNGTDEAAKLKHSKKGTQLFLLILLNKNESVSIAKLQKQIWKDDKLKNPESTFKTLLSRTRKLLFDISPRLGKSITAKNTSLTFTLPPSVEVDIYNFYDICKTLKTVDTLNTITIHQFEEILYLYRGDLFNYDEDNFSIRFVSSRLREQYVEAAKHYIELLVKKENNFMVVNVAEQILRIIPEDIDLQIISMRAYAQCGFHNTAMQKYSEYTDQYHKNHRHPLPQKYKDFFTEFVNGFDALPMDIDEFKSDVVQHEILYEPGGFTCDYNMFKSVFNLLVRVSERIKISNIIVLIQLNTIDGSPALPEKTNKVMKLCENIVKRNLRKSDVITRFSSSQFSLILFNISLEKAQLVTERIRTSFEKTSHSKDWILSYKMGDMFNDKNIINAK